ncbi:hypothetical protein C7953_2478 [Halanaerobium congolense]|uniref:hypothetical protein n=1 Tax=Halanaerobium congolense TaxID=54121 RepID=UPI000D4C33F0|nr:hypothetical protein [Halanaerobium congolense]PTX17679.1 hypothetical protein C7953_2478 [Halanaerobium congolense]
MQKKKTLREKLNSKLLEKSDIPVIVFLTVVFSLFFVWRMRKYSPDLSLNLFFGISRGSLYSLYHRYPPG